MFFKKGLCSISNYERAYRIFLIAKSSIVEIDYNPNFRFGANNKNEEHLKKLSLSQTPIFESKSGLYLTKSDVIALYLVSQKENNPLLGVDVNEYGKIFKYSFYISTQIDPFPIDLLFPIIGFGECDKKIEELKGRGCLVENQFTLADIFIICAIDDIYSKFYVKEHHDQYPNFAKYFEHISQMP
ncbi:hypothetical protein K502DRAFT_351750 [Neoconidiobolus thromboides FSU 785]|nr:hypothetical protein K502DRAFT_351750 [Neoconidiobolus thromboides FSU 785]